MLSKIYCWLTTTLMALSLVFSANAADVKWDMANEYQESSIHGEGQKVFSSTLQEKSGGSIIITNHFGGSIGYKSKEHFDAVGDGALPIANTSMGQVAGIEPIFLLSSDPIYHKVQYPTGDKKFPAVILLHTSGGFKTVRKQIPKYIKNVIQS